MYMYIHDLMKAVKGAGQIYIEKITFDNKEKNVWKLFGNIS